MNRWSVTLATLLLISLAAVSCSGGGSPTPLTPDSNLPDNGKSATTQVTKQLWGYYDLYFDFNAGTVEANVNRTVQFNANVVQFLNGSGGIGFPSLVVDPQPTYIGVDIDVAITHPLPDEAYNGYNVMGVFIGDGSSAFDYNAAAYAANGTDQTLDNADGYTRWFNPSEFAVPGVLGYTPGVLATPGYDGSATVNAYKLYGDGLGTDDVAYDFVVADTSSNVFSASTTNTRNYMLRFPIPTPNVMYNYAVVASWDGELPENHPAPTTEVVAADVDVTDDIYFDGTVGGGNLILDISLGGYGAQPSTIIIESNVLSAGSIVPGTTITDGGDNFSTYHVEIPADNVTSTLGNEFWVIAEYGGSDYSNEFGVPNDAEADPLAAYFRYSLFVADEPYNMPPVVESGVTGNTTPFAFGTYTYTVVASDPNSDPLTYSWDVFDVAGGVEVITDDPGNGDGTIDIDYSTLGAANGDQFEIDCEVSDGIAPPVAATQLVATATTTLYKYDGTVNDGGMLLLQAGGGSSWNFYATEQAWREGTTVPYVNTNCTILGTPSMNLPAGSYNLHLKITHWGGQELYYDGGFIGYTTNGGSTYTMYGPSPGSLWLTYSSGTNFNFPNLPMYGLTYQDMPNCTWFDTGSGWPYLAPNWQARVFCNAPAWGSPGAPITSDWTCNTLKGTNNVQFSFMWRVDTCCTGLGGGIGWQIRSVEIYGA